MDGFEGEEFSLKWNYHQHTVVTAFDSLLNNGTFTDCTLAAEGKFIQAHRVILSVCSPYFAAIFSQQFEKHSIVVLHGIKFRELRDMMDYMYKGEVNVCYGHLSALLMAAKSLQIKGLSEHVSKSNEYDDDRYGDGTSNGDLLKRQQTDPEPINDAVKSGQDTISLQVNGEIHTQQDTGHKKDAVTAYDEDMNALNNTQHEISQLVSPEPLESNYLPKKIRRSKKLIQYDTDSESDTSSRPEHSRKRKRRSNVDVRNYRPINPPLNNATMSQDVSALSKLDFSSKCFNRSKSLDIPETSYEGDTEQIGQYAATKLQYDESGYITAKFGMGVRASNVLICNGFTFTKSHAGPERTYWRCTKRTSAGCRASAFTKIINGTCMMSDKIGPKHSHLLPIQQKIE